MFSIGKRLYVTIAFFLLVSGCEDTEKLKGLSKVGLVEFTFDSRVMLYNSDERSSRRVSLEKGSIRAAENVVYIADKGLYFDQVTDRFLAYLDTETPWQIRVPNANLPLFQKNPKIFGPSIYQARVFKGVFMPRSSVDIAQLCTVMGVDALMSVHVEFSIQNRQFYYWENESRFKSAQPSYYWSQRVLESEPSLLILDVFIRIVDREGNVLFAHSFREEKDTASMEVLMSEVLEIRAVDSEWFGAVIDSFFKNIAYLLN